MTFRTNSVREPFFIYFVWSISKLNQDCIYSVRVRTSYIKVRSHKVNGMIIDRYGLMVCRFPLSGDLKFTIRKFFGNFYLTRWGRDKMPAIFQMTFSNAFSHDDVTNGNIFHFTGPLWGELTGHRWIPSTKASDA